MDGKVSWRWAKSAWTVAAGVGCAVCGIFLGESAQAGPANSMARYLGVGWSEGRHAHNRCPESLHHSKPWSYPITKLWNNETGAPCADGRCQGGAMIPESAVASPLVPQQSMPNDAGPQPTLAPPRSSSPFYDTPPIVPPDWKPSSEKRAPGTRTPGKLAPSRDTRDEDTEALPEPSEVEAPETSEDSEERSPSDRRIDDDEPSMPPEKKPAGDSRYPLETKSPKNFLRSWFPSSRPAAR